LQHQGRVQAFGNPVRHGGGADVPGDVAPQVGLGYAQVAEAARDAVAGVVADQKEPGGSLGPDHGKGRRLVLGEEFEVSAVHGLSLSFPNQGIRPKTAPP
jgi:hypothetical protein